MKTLVIGVGNPFAGDDGVGVYVTEKVRDVANPNDELHVKTVGAGGLHLIEEMFGYDRVILIDAIVTGSDIGKIHELGPSDFSQTTCLSSPHDLNFSTAYELAARLSPESMPKKIEIYAIGIGNSVAFSEELSPAVRKAAEVVSNKIVQSLTKAESFRPRAISDLNANHDTVV